MKYPIIEIQKKKNARIQWKVSGTLGFLTVAQLDRLKATVMAILAMRHPTIAAAWFLPLEPSNSLGFLPWQIAGFAINLPKKKKHQNSLE